MSRADNKNPYSSVGRDKFSVVLSELEAKKKRIMAKTGSEDDTVVRFKYSSSGGTKGWIPIVVRPKDQQQQPTAKPPRPRPRPRSTSSTKPPRPAAATDDNHLSLQQIQEEESQADLTKELVPAPAPAPAPAAAAAVTRMNERKDDDVVNKCRVRFYWNVHYWQVAVLLLLACLLLAGRAFAICSVTMFWYALPMARSLDDGDGKNLWTFYLGEIVVLRTTASNLHRSNK